MEISVQLTQSEAFLVIGGLRWITDQFQESDGQTEAIIQKVHAALAVAEGHTDRRGHAQGGIDVAPRQPLMFWLWNAGGCALYHARILVLTVLGITRAGRNPRVYFRVLDATCRLLALERACWRKRFQHERLEVAP